MTQRRLTALAVTLGVLTSAWAVTAAPAEAHGGLVLVSSRADGGLGSRASGTFGLTVSGDGGTVAFASMAGDLLVEDPDTEVDVYVKHLGSGELTLASTSAAGVKARTFSLRPSLDASGSQVAFMSAADNLHEGDTDGSTDAFVKDLATGELVLASTSAAGVKGNADSSLPVLSGNGDRVAFLSRADNLVAQEVDNGVDVYVKDLSTGAVDLVTVGADGRRAPVGPYGVGRVSISGDGSRVAFDTDAALDPADADGAPDVYVKDLATGALELVSTAVDGSNSARGSYRPSLSADGHTVAFDSFSADLLPLDPAEDGDVYVKDLQTGALALASSDAEGTKADARSTDASLSSDGRYVAFSSNATNLHPGDTSGTLDTFVKDLVSGAVELASDTPAGVGADALSIAPTISADGSLVAFATPATDLDATDTNRVADVYARHLHEATAPPVDDTAPTVEVSVTPDQLSYGGTGTVTVSGQAHDAGSGVERVTLTVTDEYGEAVPGVEPVEGDGASTVPFLRALELPAWAHAHDLDGRDYRITVDVVDLAGKCTSTHVHVVALPPLADGAPLDLKEHS